MTPQYPENGRMSRAATLLVEKMWKPFVAIATRLGQLSPTDAKLLRGIGPSIATRFFVMAAGLLSSVITAKALGPAGRGEYYYIITIATLAMQFGNLGLASNNIYAVVRDPPSMPRLAANSFWVSLVVGGLSALGVLAFELLFDDNGPGDKTAVLPVLVFSSLYGLLAANLLIGMGLTNKYNAYMLFSTSLQLLAILIVALYGGGVSSMLWVSAFTGVVSACALNRSLRAYGAMGWSFDADTLRSGMTFAGRVYVVTLLGYFVSRLGVIMVDRWCSPSELGYYSVAIQFSDALIVLPATTAMLLFPELVRNESVGRLPRTIRTAGLVAITMTALCLLVGGAAPWFVPALFGNAFNPSVQVLRYALPGVLALSLLNIVSQYLAAEGFPVSNIFVWIGCVFLQFAMGYCLIPIWGAAGAAVSLSITYGLLAFALLVISVGRSKSFAVN